MPNKTLLIDAQRAFSLPELYQLLGPALWPGRSTPPNLDALADLLRDSKVRTIVLADCHLQIPDFQALSDVCHSVGCNIKVISRK